MKKTGSIRHFLTTAVLGIALMGHQTVQSQELQTEPAATDTNLPSAVETLAPPAVTLPSDIDPDSAYAELVRLVQAGVDQGVILAYVKNSLRFFELDGDRIIYLADLGTPPDVIEAAMERDKQLFEKGITPEEPPQSEAQAAATATHPPPEVTEEYLYTSLAPYGSWIYVEGYGRCWRPTVVIHHSGWRPYCDNGRWVYTDYGWYWMSNYSWGWAAFHYGRWFQHARYGWCWWPDTVWSPSWVCWRYERNYCGWAPLPPYTRYRSGVGFIYRGSRVNVGFNFGLDVNAFTFVATQNFCDPHPRRHRIADRQTNQRIYDRTTPFHKIGYDQGRRRIVNSGIAPSDITAVTKQNIHPVSIRHSPRGASGGKRVEQLDHRTRTLTIDRPRRDAPDRQTASQMRRSTPRSGPQAALPPERKRPQAGNQTSDATRSPTPAQNFKRTAPSTDPRPQTSRSTPPAAVKQQPRTVPKTAPQPRQPRTTSPQSSGRKGYAPASSGGPASPAPGNVQQKRGSAPAPGLSQNKKRPGPSPKAVGAKRGGTPAPAARPKAKSKAKPKNLEDKTAP